MYTFIRWDQSSHFYNIESINLENLSLWNWISPKFQNLSLTLHCRSLEIPVKVKVESFCGWDQKLISRKSGKVCDSFWWVGEGCQEEEGWVKIAQLSFSLKPELPLIVTRLLPRTKRIGKYFFLFYLELFTVYCSVCRSAIYTWRTICWALVSCLLIGNLEPFTPPIHVGGELVNHTFEKRVTGF